MEIKKLFEPNRFGINIVKCCSSCKHKLLDNNARICLIDRSVVPSYYLCPSWKMNPCYDNAGKGDGSVKRKEYLQYVLDRLSKDNSEAIAASSMKRQHQAVTIAEIRADFLKKGKKINAIKI